MTVLIVDDHPSFRASARTLLESEGFDVVGEAADGGSAVEQTRALSPDVVLLDVQLPDIPEPLRGQSFAVVEAIYQGDEADGARLIAPLRELGPQIDTFATIPAVALSHLHMDPEHPVPGKGDGMLLADAPDAALDAMIAATDPQQGSALLSSELRQLGGAIARSERLDPVGFVTLAILSGLGGGLIRDTLLQHGTPVALTGPAYIPTALAGALLAFFLRVDGRV